LRRCRVVRRTCQRVGMLMRGLFCLAMAAVSCVMLLACGQQNAGVEQTSAGSILLHNMEQLQIDPGEIDVVVLSHIHGDHVGGLGGILDQNSDVVVYLPVSFPQGLKDDISRYGAEVQEVDEPRELFDGVYTTGELDGGIREQSLMVKTDEGLIVITGCAHPGVVNVVRRAREVAGDRVYLLIGGFHLGGASASKIESIIDDFEQMGVERVAACHCSGDTARALFQEHYGEGYIECGVGRRIALPLEG